MDDMKVKQIHKIYTIEPPLVYEDTPLKEVIEVLLKDPKSRSIYVVNKEKKLKGVISTNILLKTTHFLKGKRTLRKEDALNAYKISSAKVAIDISHPPIFVFEDTDILKALEIMIEENVQEIPVVDSKKVVIGDLNCLEILKILWT